MNRMYFFANVILLAFLFGCKDGSTPAVSSMQVEQLGVSGIRPLQGNLSFQEIFQKSDGSQWGGGYLTFNFLQSQQVNFFVAPAGALPGVPPPTCSWSITLSEGDMAFVQDLLSEIPICKYTYPPVITFECPTVVTSIDGVGVVSGMGPYFAAGSQSLQVDLSICDPRYTGGGTVTTNCDETLVDDVTQYLASKVTGQEVWSCSGSASTGSQDP